ncbi:hypothetical protein ACEWY4_015935 [Coilia grayii]|uniref:Resistance to inhibitors of cholinesterase protein 3 N-terminal domain-containing protein n=1 Tax=Coilia grayii TaxID=363190 RepID=A0ABD1JQ97_9TELE
MSITTFQKVTLVTCIVLCISLFLPKMVLREVKKEMMPKAGKGIIHTTSQMCPVISLLFPSSALISALGSFHHMVTSQHLRQSPSRNTTLLLLAVGPGHYPTGMPRKHRPEGLEPWEAEAVYPDTLSSEAIARAKAKAPLWGSKKSNHFGQVVPIYGVGILFYILHIFFKLTRKDKKTKKCPSSNSGLPQNISEEELARLEDRLTHAEMMINRVLSPQSSRVDSGRSQCSSRKRESSLLRRLRKFRRSLQEEQRDGMTPEMEAEEVPYTIDWEGYSEETFPQYDEPCGPRKYETIIVQAPDPDKPSAEELAEQMEKEDEEAERELGVIAEEDEEEMEEDAEETEESRDEDGDDDDVDDDEDEEEEVETEDDLMMKSQEEEEEEEEEDVGEETPCLRQPERAEERSRKMGLREFLSLTPADPSARRRRHITFSDHDDIFTYPREGTIYEKEEADEDGGEEDYDDDHEDDDEDEEEEEQEHQGAIRARSVDVDPLMEAESLRFSMDHSSDPEEEAEPEHAKWQEEEDDDGDDDDGDDSDDDYDDEGEEDDGQEVGLEEFLSTYCPGINARLSQATVDPPPTSTELRMRNKSRDKNV